MFKTRKNTSKLIMYIFNILALPVNHHLMHYRAPWAHAGEKTGTYYQHRQIKVKTKKI